MSNDASLPAPLLPSAEPAGPIWRTPDPPRRFQHVVWKHVLLFFLTFATTTLVGLDHYAAFAAEFGRRSVVFEWALLAQGLWYSLTILAILGAHEMGHYIACRIYRIDATLPYFLPMPPPFLTGTLGAVIRIREAFPNRTALFDVGVAGPIAGFAVLLPALFVGLSLSAIVPAPTEGSGLYLGEPLLFQWASQIMFGTVADGFTINMHPMVFASWFGMLATALNLLPFGQLDGGHITYATLGRYATPISLATVAAALAMTFVSTSWIVMAVMMLAMLIALGPRHPRVIYEFEPLGRGRRAVAVLAFLIFAVCFTPAPIEPYELLNPPSQPTTLAMLQP